MTTLVTIFLRGGMDGLSAVVPAGETGYYDNRTGIAIAEPDLLPLDERFGLHPALAPIHPTWAEGDLAITHAVDNLTESRSHFDAENVVEAGGADGANIGWLARHLLATQTPDSSPFRAVALGPSAPGSLRGHLQTLTLNGTFGVGGSSGLLTPYTATLRALHQGDDPIAVAGSQALDALAELEAQVSDREQRSRRRGRGQLARSLDQVSTVLDADLETEVIALDHGGWDTHQGMGDVERGAMSRQLTELGEGLGTFWQALGRRRDDVIVLVMSEFGRRVAENGTGGTDHGSGNALFVLGRGVGRGRVDGDWVGLDAGELDNGDVAGLNPLDQVLEATLVRLRSGG